jgi:cytoskeletal protein CcmA (bactofilin family)
MTKIAQGRIGGGIKIRGELRGEEDLVIQGTVEGSITFPKNHLTVDQSAVIAANVAVQDITVRGEVQGNTSASNRVEILADAKVAGDIRSPRLVMQDGAKFRGNVDMHVELPAGLID